MLHDTAHLACATALTSARELRGEVLDPSTGRVWQSLEPISREAYAALPLEPGWQRVGIGVGAMDEHGFARSPGAESDGPIEVREIGGRRFGLCARLASAPARPAGPGGPRLLMVEKHHVLRFVAGREVSLLQLPDGRRLVHVIEGGEGKAPLGLAEGWRLASVRLACDWLLRLPTPTTALFFPNGDGYQGPVGEPPVAAPQDGLPSDVEEDES